MWYRTSQLGPTLPAFLSDPTVKSLASGENNFIFMQDKIKKLIDTLEPEKQQQFKDRLESLKQESSSQNFFSSQDRMESWQTLLNDVNNQVVKQNENVVNDIKSIVKNRIVGKFENGNFNDADKTFKEYLDAQGDLNYFSNFKSGSDVFEIAKFFIENATDPKFDIVKKIINKFPTKFLNYTEVVDLLLNFYLHSKLTEVKSKIESRKPLSENDKLELPL